MFKKKICKICYLSIAVTLTARVARYLQVVDYSSVLNVASISLNCTAVFIVCLNSDLLLQSVFRLPIIWRKVIAVEVVRALLKFCQMMMLTGLSVM